MLIEDLINEIDELVEKSWSVPLSGGKCLIDIDELRKILYEMKENLPIDIQKAKEITEKEQKIIEGARSAGESIIEKAEERAKNIIDEQEIVRLSKQKAKDIILSAQKKEKEIKKNAYEYVEGIMLNLEDTLKKYLDNVRDIKNTIYSQKKQ